jgi:hypothetical protein
MKRSIQTALVFLLIHHLCIAQPTPKIVSEYPILMKGASQISFLGSNNDDGEMVPVIDKKTNDFALIRIEKKVILGLFYNSKYELIHQLTVPNLDKTQKEVLGGIGDEGLYTVFLSNEKKTIFSSVTFSTKSDEYISHAFTEIKLEKEKIIDTYSMGAKFLLLTAVKGSPTLKAYLLHADRVEIKTFNLSDVSLKDLYYTLVGPALTASADQGVKSIYTETYNSIGLASAQSKIFHQGNEVVITMDDLDPKTERHTRLITLNLETEKSDVRYLKQPVITGTIATTNSFIFDGKIFQVAINREEIGMAISEFNSLTVLEEFHAGRNDSIEFKNSPIYQEGSMYFNDTKKSYDDTGKFLNKISSPGSQVGIAVNPLGDAYEITVGAVKVFQSGGGSPVGVGFGGGGSTINTPYGKVTTPAPYNPTQYGYNSYTSSRITYFKSILTKNSLERTDIRETKNAFDWISDYDEKNTVARTVFKIEHDYMLGYYDAKAKVYRLVRFAQP